MGIFNIYKDVSFQWIQFDCGKNPNSFFWCMCVCGGGVDFEEIKELILKLNVQKIAKTLLTKRTKCS